MSDIKYFAAHYVAFQNNLTEQEKGHVIKWIKETPDDQIKSFLIRGDYEFHQEDIRLFDKTIAPLLNEATWGSFPEHVRGVIDNMDYVDGQKLWHALGKFQDKERAQAYTSGKEEGVAVGLGHAVIAAVVITIAYKVYKRFLSKAARSCKQTARDAKTLCMNKYKRDAMKQQIVQIQKGFGICGKTKDPVKCKIKLTKKIRKIKAKLGTV